VEREKRHIWEKHSASVTPEFLFEWLFMSYEGYTITSNDLPWVQKLLKTDRTDISLTYVNGGYVFKVGDDMFSLQPMEVKTTALVYKALRHEISEQIAHYRTKQFHNRATWTCEETNRKLANNADTEVDHHFRIKTFQQLAHEFFADVSSVEIEYCGMFYRLKDRSLAKEWSDFHQQHAVLRLIHRSANTNQDFYLQKYPEGAPFAPKQKQRKPNPEPLPTPLMTFDSFFAKEPGSKEPTS
jgi:hypothetical protein